MTSYGELARLRRMRETALAILENDELSDSQRLRAIKRALYDERDAQGSSGREEPDPDEEAEEERDRERLS